MRTIEQPGPVHPERVQWVPVYIHQADITLPTGVTLLDGLAQAIQSYGVSSAVFSVVEGGLAPLAYYMPALSPSDDHVAYFSAPFHAPAEVTLRSGSITLGQREQQPWLHCHAIWADAQGAVGSGHIIPNESRVSRPLRLKAWWMQGASFQVMPDPETNFSLFQIVAQPPSALPDRSPNAFVVRLRPNQDVCMALEAFCAEHGMAAATVRGGVGSLVGIVFDDGRSIEAFATEVFIEQGTIMPDAHGQLHADLRIGGVAHSGDIAQGRLARGQNAVLITFELIIEPVTSASRHGDTLNKR